MGGNVPIGSGHIVMHPLLSTGRTISVLIFALFDTFYPRAVQYVE